MICPKCKSENVTTQIVSEQVIKERHKGLFYYLFIAWWFWMVKFIVFLITWPFKIFGHTKKTSFTEHKTMSVCQNCGHTWKV